MRGRPSSSNPPRLVVSQLQGNMKKGKLSPVEKLKAGIDKVLFFAALRNIPNAAQAAIECGASIDKKFGLWNLLHWAADRGHSEVLAVILKAGADVNSRDHRGKTALHLAAANGHIEALDVLLKAGADIEAVNNSGLKPLVSAATAGKISAVLRLAEAGAEVNLPVINELDFFNRIEDRHTIKVLRSLGTIQKTAV